MQLGNQAASLPREGTGSAQLLLRGTGWNQGGSRVRLPLPKVRVPLCLVFAVKTLGKAYKKRSQLGDSGVRWQLRRQGQSGGGMGAALASRLFLISLKI